MEQADPYPRRSANCGPIGRTRNHAGIRIRETGKGAISGAATKAMDRGAINKDFKTGATPRTGKRNCGKLALSAKIVNRN